MMSRPAPRPAAKRPPPAKRSAVATEVVALRGRAAWAGPAGIAAVVVLAIQLVWRTVYLAQGYFTQDDFLMLSLGGTSPMSLSYLWQDYAGHLWPGAFVIAFIEARVAPLSWPAAYVPIVVMQLGAGVLMWMLLSRLLGPRWERLPLLAVFCFSPLTLWATQWWAVAITLLPLELCSLGASLSYLRWKSDGKVWGLRLVPVLAATGLLFQERGMLIPLVVLTVAVISYPAPGVWRRFTGTLRSDPRLWSGLAAIVIGYLLLHLWLAPVQATGGGRRGDVDLVSNFLFRNVTPGLFGGPWTGVVLPGAVIPPSWVVVLSVGLLGALIASTLVYGGTTAHVAWLVLMAYGVMDVALLFGGRAQYGSAFGLLPRYAADMMPVLVIALAGAVRDLRTPAWVSTRITRVHTPARRGLACVLVTIAYTGSAAITTHLMAPDLYNTQARLYVQNLSDDLSQQPSVVLYDSTVPDDVMISWFGSNDRVSTVYGLASRAPKFDVPSEQMRIVDSTGHVREIDFVDPVSAMPGPSTDCGYNVTLNPLLIAMQSPLPLGKNVMQLGYYTNANDVAVLRAGTKTVKFPVFPGLHSVHIVLDTAFENFTVRLSRTAATLCLAAATAGVPKPAAQ